MHLTLCSLKKIIWKNSTNGGMCFKDAYLFQKPLLNEVSWVTHIWKYQPAKNHSQKTDAC